MRKAITIVGLLLFCLPLFSQTVFSYGKYQVSQEEFLQAFNKNNPARSSAEAIKEYLDLYINFKLKVQAAKDLRLDTTAAQKADLFNFRQQIIDNYLSDDSTIDALCNEALLRHQRDIRVGHIFVPFDNTNLLNTNAAYPSMPIEDTLEAFKKISAAYNALQKGSSFSSVALEYSGDPAVKKTRGDIGFVTVFSLPYPIENMVYSLQPGQYCRPYKSRGGYHIFINFEERPAAGTMKAAQILLPFTPGMSEQEKKTLRARADSIHHALSTGAPWNSLARQFSLSNNPSAADGAIPDITVGKYDPVFERAAMDLETDGAVTSPFETNYGIHIVKRLALNAPTKDSTEAKKIYRTAVIQSGRLDVIRAQQVDMILQKAAYKKVFANEALLWEVTDSLLANKNYLPARGITDKTVLFTLKREETTMTEWWAHIQVIRDNYRPGTVIPYALIMQNYVIARARTYYQNHLEDFNPAFAAQLRAFAEGNLLFDVMERQVWSKASKDENMLKKYYSENPQKYQWAPGFTGIYFTAENSKVADRIKKETADFVAAWRTVAESTSGKIISDSARFELAQLPGLDINSATGRLYELQRQSAEEETVHLLYITAIHPIAEQKSFEEAKGLIINDYQTVLENQWLKKLRRKYKVRVNKAFIATLK